MKTKRYRPSQTVYICEKCGLEDTDKEYMKDHEKECKGK